MPPSERRRSFWERLALAAPLAIFVIVYAPAVGHGFIADDFRWVVESRVDRVGKIPALFLRNTGFYRPIVALTFAANDAMFGNRPLGYGVTNLILAGVCAVLLAVLIRTLGLPREAAIAGSAVWLMNFHGIDMAILWISGRTALVLIAASLITAIALLRGHVVLAAAGLLTALLAKEEAVALPFVLFAWLMIRARSVPEPASKRFAWIAVSVLSLVAYWQLRQRSGAFTVNTAPPYYHLTFSPALIVENGLQYADRALTFPAAICLAAWLLLRPGWSAIRWAPEILACGVVWILGGYALTVFLPVRSSLYSCFPSIGSAIVAAWCCAEFWRRSEPAARRRAVAASIVISAALLPVYRARAHRWIDPADLSSSVLAQLRTLTADVPDGAHVVLIDDRSKRVNLESTFGSLMNDAYTLSTGRSIDIWIDPPVASAVLAGLAPPCASCVALKLRLEDGTVRRSRD
ncbi:MAG TPA: hypothetical protein VGY57_05710 [Vicinamibacterales bacterium]|jgi:hypothetical protein|nr:hypothetical protein [Vicinamibacterales bacterium]